MSGPSGLVQWLLVAPLLLAFVAALIPIIWLWRNRNHPPGQCQRCGYPLHGNRSGACPECGTGIRAGDS